MMRATAALLFIFFGAASAFHAHLAVTGPRAIARSYVIPLPRGQSSLSCLARSSPAPRQSQTERFLAMDATGLFSSNSSSIESRQWSAITTVVLLSTTAALAGAFLLPKAAAAAAATMGEHLHVGQKIANFFRQFGLPDEAVLMLISAMPVVELRGGIPVGLWMGLPLTKVFALCVVGNMAPIPVILLALRSKLVRQLAKPVLDRAKEKAAALGDADSQALALTLFVGIPLPGTGAWTGAMGAFLLGMPFQKAMLSIFAGVAAAGTIMSALTLAGRTGAIVATAVLAAFCVSAIAGNKGK